MTASEYQVGLAAVSRIREVEELPTELDGAADGGHPPPDGPAALEFREVSFRYSPELPSVHEGMSFSVPPLGMTAFVGPSGTGKTTLFSLIERFYEPTGGTILLDGRDLRDWNIAALRSMIGYVEQDAPVLSGTLRENLLLGHPEADEQDVLAAVRKTRLTELVEGLPDGLESQVGPRGVKLSGGERQRLAIARALSPPSAAAPPRRDHLPA